MRPKASLIVPTRGGAQRLPRLFDALRAQTEASWEAVVVVDGDIDGTALLLSEMRRELPVVPIVFPSNRGRSAALNAGFGAARGEVLIRCDDDLRPAPGYIAGHAARHEAETPVGVVGIVRNVYPETPYARAYGYSRDARFREDAYRVPAERRWRYWCGNVSTTRGTFDHVGPYDTSFRAYGWEDVDWGFRLAQSGTKIVFAPELETDHHIAATTTEIRVRRAFYSGAAKLTFAAKHGAGPTEEPAAPKGPWEGLVDRTAKRSSLERLLHLARRADRTLDRTPHWLAEKHAAWLVESAGRAGELHPGEVLADV